VQVVELISRVSDGRPVILLCRRGSCKGNQPCLVVVAALRFDNRVLATRPSVNRATSMPKDVPPQIAVRRLHLEGFGEGS
jgi:hypothetical protein